MTTQTEVLKMALEALCTCGPQQKQAITAIKEALAQPEQEPVALQMDVIVVNLVREGINKHRARELAEHFIKNTTPPQRDSSATPLTWVGLTPQERDEINEQVYGAVPHHVAFHHAIETKLKEKNT